MPNCAHSLYLYTTYGIGLCVCECGSVTVLYVFISLFLVQRAMATVLYFRYGFFLVNNKTTHGRRTTRVFFLLQSRRITIFTFSYGECGGGRRIFIYKYRYITHCHGVVEIGVVVVTTARCVYGASVTRTRGVTTQKSRWCGGGPFFVGCGAAEETSACRAGGGVGLMVSFGEVQNESRVVDEEHSCVLCGYTAVELRGWSVWYNRGIRRGRVSVLKQAQRTLSALFLAGHTTDGESEWDSSFWTHSQRERERTRGDSRMKTERAAAAAREPRMPTWIDTFQWWWSVAVAVAARRSDDGKWCVEDVATSRVVWKNWMACRRRPRGG